MTKNLNEMLGLDKLDETKQSEITDYINEMVDLKAQELVEAKKEAKKEDMKAELVESYEAKFIEYKDDITSKFSNFVDGIMEQELYIPESIQEYARKGELYEDVMSKLKITMAIDEDVLSDEVKDILKEAKEEIITLKSKVNGLISEKNELTEDAKTLSTNIYLRKKCDGLAESKKERIMSLLEDIQDTNDIDKKFDILVNETTLITEKKVTCPKCGAEVEVEDDDMTCPECGENMGKEDGEGKKKGKGKEEVDESFKEELKENTAMAT